MSDYNNYPRGTWLEVDLLQLKDNVRILKDTAGTDILVVVKGNAYGHGLIPCARAAVAAGARMLGIATISEGALLREAGIKTDILRLTAYLPEEIQYMVENDIACIVWTKHQVDVFQKQAEACNKVHNVHLKVDTGMGRVGVFPEHALEIAQYIVKQPHLYLEGVCSHFHSAEATPETSEKQMAKFEDVLTVLKKHSVKPGLVHLANSRGLLKFKEARYNMVRSGVVTYGLPYADDFALPDGIGPVAQWKARIVSIRQLPKGHVVSYGGQYTTKRDNEKIAIIPVGYVDGLHRFPPDVNEVLINGRILKTVGRICMDQTHISIPEDMDVREGDEVVILGTQGGGEITSLDIAQRWGTNKYDVLVGIHERVPRVYKT